MNYKKSFDIRSLDLTLIEFPLESCGVNEIANSINVFVDGNKMKKIRGRDINFILKKIGILDEEIVDNKKKSVTNGDSVDYGISVEERNFYGDYYKKIVFNENGVFFLLNLLIEASYESWYKAYFQGK
ncbi:MAG: hypothetical protein KBE24_11715 [Fusobacteriaceae bacterium]|nr:hypothetical protein [Fusobacteriaceae bacterium]